MKFPSNLIALLVALVPQILAAPAELVKKNEVAKRNEALDTCSFCSLVDTGPDFGYVCQFCPDSSGGGGVSNIVFLNYYINNNDSHIYVSAPIA